MARRNPWPPALNDSQAEMLTLCLTFSFTENFNTVERACVTTLADPLPKRSSHRYVPLY